MARYWSSLAVSACVVAAVGLIHWYYTRRRESKTSTDVVSTVSARLASPRIAPSLPLDHQSKEIHGPDTPLVSSVPADCSSLGGCGAGTATVKDMATVDSQASSDKGAVILSKAVCEIDGMLDVNYGNIDVSISPDLPIAQASTESDTSLVHAADAVVDVPESDTLLPAVHACDANVASDMPVLLEHTHDTTGNIATTASDMHLELADDTNVAVTASDMEAVFAMIYDGIVNPTRQDQNEMPSQLEPYCPLSAWRRRDPRDTNSESDMCMPFSSLLDAQSHPESDVEQDFEMALLRRLRDSSAGYVDALNRRLKPQSAHLVGTTGAASTGFSSDTHFCDDSTVSWHNIPRVSAEPHTHSTSPHDTNAPSTCSPDFIVSNPACAPALPDLRLAGLEEERQRWCAEFLRGRLQADNATSSGSVGSVNDPHSAPVLGAHGVWGSFLDTA